ncbi:MAG: Hsp70 family protein, partial [Spirochaetes bacterium]|nr:Hsp70 family protein [Spirochaetota bacterium]
MAKIGIRLADGKFYPILDEGAAIKKRLVVTTVKDDQPSVQIDVYRSTEASDAYVGSLIIENIPPRPSGEPDIRLDLGLDDEGNLNAMAREEATGEHQTLTVSLKSLAEEEKYEIPDFDFQEDEEFDLSTDDLPEVNPFEPEPGSDSEPDGDIPSFDEPSEETRTRAEEPRRKASPILVGILAAVGTAIILVAAFFIYRCTADRPAEPPRT